MTNKRWWQIQVWAKSIEKIYDEATTYLVFAETQAGALAILDAQFATVKTAGELRISAFDGNVVLPI